MSHKTVISAKHIGRDVPRDVAMPLVRERFMRRLVTKDSGCVEYVGPANDKGYGQFTCWGRRFTAHRLAWELANGEIAAGLQVCHTCDNPPCCNPDHLWLGTNSENQEDAHRKGRKRMQSATHCERGHEYTPDNTRFWGPRGSNRICKTCQRIRHRLNAGWPEELANSLAKVPQGYTKDGAPVALKT